MVDIKQYEVTISNKVYKKARSTSRLIEALGVALGFLESLQIPTNPTRERERGREVSSYVMHIHECHVNMPMLRRRIIVSLLVVNH